MKNALAEGQGQGRQESWTLIGWFGWSAWATFFGTSFITFLTRQPMLSDDRRVGVGRHGNATKQARIVWKSRGLQKCVV